MKALVLEEKDNLQIRDIAIEEALGPNDVRIKIAKVGVCGSDVHYYKHGRIGDFIVNEPMVLGHEASGVIAEVGSAVKNLKVGDRVAMEPGIFDPNSPEAMQGHYHLDPSIRFWATPPIHGVLRESVVHPASLTFKLPDNVSLEEAVLAEPLTSGTHVARKVGIAPGDTAVVAGAGTIGSLMALALLASGASRVIITDVKQEKLDFLSENYGERLITCNVAKTDLKEFVLQHFTNGADLFVDCSGNAKAIAAAPHCLRPAGKLVFVGMPQDLVPMDIVAMQVKEIETVGIFRYANDYERSIALIASGQINVKPLISCRYAFKDSIEAFDLAASAQPDVIKVLIDVQ
ncbi:NAD(P)-dependent alcohol dehydrogenase [Paraburkholderia guartelaensis]|uniref:NAD(P)-dependent alcohol dehydrogenase n=1 Tax=Paraburkholderia guartelaensis TaxID=2546446 RepID=UPI002AB75718|nr:NAD(P)-dependent alcohol dehydrogenase [Paraburkholderia guartelaensis]